MKVKFSKQMAVDYMTANDEVMGEKTFRANEIIDVVSVEETFRGYVDITFQDGGVAVGVPKQGLTIL